MPSVAKDVQILRKKSRTVFSSCLLILEAKENGSRRRLDF
jgi:hypothetical protein